MGIFSVGAEILWDVKPVFLWMRSQPRDSTPCCLLSTLLCLSGEGAILAPRA